MLRTGATFFINDSTKRNIFVHGQKQCDIQLLLAPSLPMIIVGGPSSIILPEIVVTREGATKRRRLSTLAGIYFSTEG